MKLINKILTPLIIIALFSNIVVFAWKTEKNIIKCTWKQWFELYSCEKINVCKKSDFWNQTQKIATLEQDPYKKDTNFKTAQKIYKTNQNNIYKCGILNSQKKAFIELKALLKNTDTTGITKTKIIPKIEKKLKKINILFIKNKCKTISQNSENKKSIKKILLDQSTLQYCDYRYFLKYLNYLEKNDLEKNFPKWAKEVSVKKFSEIIIENQNTIQNEIEHTDKLYPIAYQTFTGYDSFIKVHIVLELLKEDYRTLRDKLYQTLHPINQVVYKIINAQSK